MKITKEQKIAFFLPSLAGGGAEKIALNLAQAFAERGFNIDIILGEATGEYLKNVPASIRLIGLNKSRPFLAIPALVKYLRVERPKVLFSTIINANIAALLAWRLSGLQIRCVVREASTLSIDLARSSALNRQLVPRVISWLFPMAHAIVAPSNGVADDLARVTGLSRESIHVIYNPVVTQTILNKAQQPVPHDWLSKKSVPVIVGMGRLTLQKDFETLIRAFACVKKHLAARLIILGEGELRANLESLCIDLDIESDVEFMGFIDNPYAYLSKADLFVLSSQWEGLPSALIEALACGVKVVSTDCPSGPREILNNGIYGQLVPVGDHILMAEAMRRSLMGEFLSQAPSEQIRLFEAEGNINRFLELLVG